MTEQSKVSSKAAGVQRCAKKALNTASPLCSVISRTDSAARAVWRARQSIQRVEVRAEKIDTHHSRECKVKIGLLHSGQLRMAGRLYVSKLGDCGGVWSPATGVVETGSL
ncbi:hypothetical protein PCANC_28664 [Puccinia coronata f. sp. avenae]|uniref:Uncharacterized protein n=1 Tax=Puccinia coronata f. sp. avenae TaxID=200324 RepID=A0A2N5TL00_9BASI|nr:hypothetical protein PCANC_28664 [Puccinia coronata f. sp. avenae]